MCAHKFIYTNKSLQASEVRKDTSCWCRSQPDWSDESSGVWTWSVFTCLIACESLYCLREQACLSVWRPTYVLQSWLTSQISSWRLAPLYRCEVQSAFISLCDRMRFSVRVSMFGLWVKSVQEPRTHWTQMHELRGMCVCVHEKVLKCAEVTSVQSLWQQTGHSGERGYEFWVQRTDPCMVKWCRPSFLWPYERLFWAIMNSPTQVQQFWG